MTLLTKKIPINMAGLRLDRALAELFPEYSRSKLQTWIKSGRVQVEGEQLKAKDTVKGNEAIVLDAEAEAVVECQPEDIPLDIVHEDEALLIINKPAGLVVHPAVGNWQGTLQNALLHHFPDLVSVPRAGIVHRLDKDTSGLLMIAKTLQAHTKLVEQLQNRSIEREYMAITQGRMIAGGTVDAAIGRHPVDRKRNTVRDDGKLAVTHYRVLQRFSRHTLIRVKLETGRTHQIRVHMAHIRYPLLGDPVYGGRFRLPANCSEALELQLRTFKRQALHAAKLGLVHPQSGEFCAWEAPLPSDLETMIVALTAYDQQLDNT